MHVIRRRRRQGVTNYSKRVALLKSRLPRVVVRRSNRGILMQVCSYAEKGDIILTSVNSKELKKFGWLPKRNTPTAYLTGALLAKKAVKLDLKECVLDIGLNKPTKASVLFAAAKGAADNGLKIMNNIEFDEKRIHGEHIKSYSQSIDKDDKRFSLYRKSNIDVGKIDELFNKVNDAIKQ